MSSMPKCEYTCKKIDSKNDYDLIIKCLIAGEENVGKTSILYRLTDQEFVLNQTPTIGMDFGTIYSQLTSSMNNTYENSNTELDGPDNEMTVIKKEEKIIKVQIWDCAGQMRFRNIVQSYFRQAQIFLFVYDRSDINSFTYLSDWILSVDQHIGRGNYIGCIIANKTDLPEQIDSSIIEKFCETNNDFSYYTLSAKCDSEEEILKPILECILKTYRKYVNGEISIEKPYWKDSTVNLEDDISETPECLPGQCKIL